MTVNTSVTTNPEFIGPLGYLLSLENARVSLSPVVLELEIGRFRVPIIYLTCLNINNIQNLVILQIDITTQRRHRQVG